MIPIPKNLVADSKTMKLSLSSLGSFSNPRHMISKLKDAQNNAKKNKGSTT